MGLLDCIPANQRFKYFFLLTAFSLAAFFNDMEDAQQLRVFLEGQQPQQQQSNNETVPSQSKVGVVLCQTESGTPVWPGELISCIVRKWMFKVCFFSLSFNNLFSILFSPRMNNC